MDQTIEDVFSEIKEMKASEFPIRKVKRIQEDISCMDLIDSFIKETSPITIVVNDEGKYTGVLTIKSILPLLQRRKTDLHEAISRSRVLSCVSACDLAKKQFPIVLDDDEINVVASLMESYDTAFLPRAKERKGEIIGTIALMDILAKVKENWIGACKDIEDE